MMPSNRKVLSNWTPEQIAAASSKMRPELVAALNAMNDHGGNYPAAARALGIRLGTLKSRLHRARKAIADVRVSQGEQPDPAAAKLVSDVASALEEHGDQYFDELRSMTPAQARRGITAEQAAMRYPNGRPYYATDGTLLDDKGNRSIFDDVDE